MSEIPPTIITPLHYLFESNLTMAINAMSCTMFLGNTYHSLWLLYSNRKTIYKLCFVQSVVGLVINLMILGTFFSFDKACPARIMLASAGNLVSMTCIELILLTKARMASQTLSPHFTYFGGLLIVAKVVGFILNMVFSEISVTPLYNCSVSVSMVFGGLAVGLELIVNLYLSLFFLSIIYRQWKFNRLMLYESLMKDGLLYSLGAAATSVTVVILVFSKVLNSNSAVLFNISWVVASTLTVSQLRNAFKIKNRGTLSSNNNNNNHSNSANNNSSDASRTLRDKASTINRPKDSLVVNVQYESNDTYGLSTTHHSESTYHGKL